MEVIRVGAYNNKLLVLNLLHLERITSYVVARKTKFSKERSSVRNPLPHTLTYKQLVSLDSSELEVLSLLGCPSYVHLLAETNSVTLSCCSTNGSSLVKSTGFSLDPSSTRPH